MGAQKPYRTIPLGNLTGGLNDTAAETALLPGQGLRVENFDLDRGALTSARGSIKLNNQVAPRSAVRCRPDPALSPLYFKTGYGVPLRGYCWAAYNKDFDIGGDFAYEGDFALGSETFHNRRGRSFQLDVSFRLPEDERFYEAETRGVNAPAVGSESVGFNPPHGFDEALDDCTIILQKGGDQTAPMSWALGIVNVGEGIGLSSAPAARPSNYALVFMWFDAPQVGESGPPLMRYTLTSGAAPSSGAYCTQAFRAVLIHKYVEPGRMYSASVQLGLDTGSPGGASANTSWLHDGYFKVYVSEGTDTPTSYTFADSGGGGTPVGMEVIRGPTDSLSYFAKYGIRFSGRDKTAFGLGMRSFPWMQPGFIPYGADCTAIGYGGFQMLDRSAVTVDTLYGAAVYTLTVAHTSGDAYVVINHQYVSSGNTNGGLSPYAIGGPGGYTAWQGAQYNTTALSGYRLIATNDFSAGAMKGGVLNIGTYSESGGSYRLSITNGATAANFGSWAASKMLIQCFRWNQRPIDIGEVRIWRTPRDYGDANLVKSARRLWDIGRGIDINDTANYDIETLQAYWPCDDSEGTVLREEVCGGIRSAFMAPGGLGVTSGGIRGGNMLALSGECEAPCIDFSENPVVMRELKNMLAGTSQGFAIELSCVFAQAYYAIQDNTITLPGRSTTGVTLTGSRPLFVPDILSWDVKDPTTTGQASTPRPLLSLTHRGALAGTNSVPFKFPMGFSVEVANVSDNENQDPIVPSDLQPFYLDGSNANVNRYGNDAPWVGKHVTIQIGVQSTGTADQYDVYLAMSPKDAFLPANGDPSDAEFAYWTKGGTTYSSSVDYQGYFAAAHLTIKRKDIVRSVVTLGRWNCGSLGYSELQPCMLVDEVRFYGASAPGALPTDNGGILTNRNGKLEGSGVLPGGELSIDDILRRPSPSGFGVDVTDGSATVTPHGTARFFPGEARTSIDSIKETYLYVPGETQRILTSGTLATTQEQFFRVRAVDSTGANLTLSQPFGSATRTNAYGASLRLLGYTAFADDIRDKPLSLGVGKAYIPGTTTVSDVVLTDVFWANVSPINVGWKVRVYSPLGRSPLNAVLPLWVRGLVGPRRNAIRGIHAHNDKVYAAVRGSLYEADDRWRADGPSVDLPKSLAFRSRTISSSVKVPEARDRVEFAAPFTFTTSTDARVTYVDAWVKLREIGDYQTLLWVGKQGSDPSAAGAAHLILRTNRGRPELVMGSSAFYTGTTQPEKGVFVATGSTPIPSGRWTHIRFAIPTRTTSARVLMLPSLKVNGRKITVSVNAIDNGAAITGAYDWITYSTLTSTSGGKMFMGVAHDAYRAPAASQSFTGTAAGRNVQPAYLWGLLHALDGQIGEMAVTQATAWAGASTGADMPDFDPFAIDYSAALSTAFRALSPAEGVAHKVYDSGGAQYGVIYSHPFVSVNHEMGLLDKAASFAEFGSELVAVSGSKPVLVTNTYAGHAGVPAPTTAPSFSIKRFPVWKPNARSVTAESASNDPVDGAVVGAAIQINHYDNHGSNYWRQVDTSAAHAGWGELLVTKVSATTARVFAFKAYVKPRKVAGRIVLFAARNAVGSGFVFVEIRDGKLVTGFYDLYLKKEVWVETSQRVFTPGYWHYVYVRKEFPQNEAYDGNWVNSYYTSGKLRRANLSATTAGSLVGGTTITGDSTTGTGYIVSSPNLSGGVGSFAASGITQIEYIKLNATELTNADNAATVTSGTVNVSGVILPTHDSMVVRRFGTAITDYTDMSLVDPLLAKVGQLITVTITAGTAFVAGDTITGGTSGVAKVLWAHTKAAVTANVQNLCVYFTSGTTFVGNLTGGGVVTCTLTSGPTDYRDAISLVVDDKTMTSGGATGWVSRPFAGSLFYGASGGVVNFDNGAAFTGGAIPFHAGMVGMYWMWGSVNAGSSTAAMRGKLYRITSVSENGKQINTVIAGTSSTDTFAGFSACEGGVFSGVALKKSTDYDLARVPDQNSMDPRAFGHEDSTFEESGISPYDGEWACPGWTTVEPVTVTNGAENYQPFETGLGYGLTGGNDPIFVGTDFFRYPIFALGAPGRLHFDSWGTAAQRGTWYCPNDVQTYAGGSNGTSSQPNYDGTTALAPVVAASSTSPTCSTNASPVRVRATQVASIYTGTRFIRYCFYDKDQDALSNPSPSLPVTADAEDAFNGTTQLRYTIGSLGVPRRTGNFEVWVFMGLAGGTEEDLFRVAQVPSGTSEVAVSLPETAISSLLPMELTNGEPQRCSLVASDGDRMYYGALESDPAAGLFSGVGSVSSIDFTAQGGSAFFAAGGQGNEITALYQLDQQVLIAKRRMLGTLGVDNGIATIKIISRSIGCVAPQSMRGKDQRVYFIGERGLALVSRYGNSNLGIPLYISSNVQGLYNEEMDRSYDSLVVGAMNERRGQYIHTYRPVGERRPTKRVTCLFKSEEGGADGNPLLVYTPNAHSFAIGDQIVLSCVGTVQGHAGEPLFMGGTDDGFLVWMDRADTQLHLMSEVVAKDSSSSTTVANSTNLSGVTLAGSATMDVALEGMRGVVMRFQAAGVDGFVRLLSAANKTVVFDELADSIPAGTVTIGAQSHRWDSGWMDCGNPQQLKNFLYLDVVAMKGTEGSMRFLLYKDQDDTTAIDSDDVELTLAQKQVDVNGLDGRWFKVSVRSVPLTTKAVVSISSMLMRLYDIDQD